MKVADAFKEYVAHLFGGRRAEARELIARAHDRGIGAAKLIQKLIWPAMVQVEKLYRGNHISQIQEQMATRINRMIADQLHALLARRPKTGQRMVVACGEGESEELGAQMLADLFEAKGWTVWFLGAGVPNDEILQFIGKVTPDILLVYGTRPAGVPGVRKLIDLIRGVGVCEEMQILVAGGVFNRAEGLAEEIRADLFAPDSEQALTIVEEHPVRVPKPDVPEPGRRRKRRRKPAERAAIRRAKAALEA